MVMVEVSSWPGKSNMLLSSSPSWCWCRGLAPKGVFDEKSGRLGNGLSLMAVVVAKKWMVG